MTRSRTAAAGLAALLVLMQTAGEGRAAPRPGQGAVGPSTSPETIESTIEPFFARKDLWALEEGAGAREAAKALGTDTGRGAVRWFHVPRPSAPLRLLSVDLGGIGQGAGSSDGAAAGYVAYAIVESGSGGSPKVSWYHDQGRKIAEQAGAAWHPLAVEWLGGEGQDAMGVACAAKPGAEPVGVLVLESRGGTWTASRRLTAGATGHLLAQGREAIVFRVPRAAPKGVLTGAPADVFRALAVFERAPDGWSQQPTLAPIPDVVSATEAIMAALRRGDTDMAKALCTSPDVVESLQYFTPTWKGGGRVVTAGPTVLEMIYEERERPTLRLTLTFRNQDGQLLLASATGKGEGGKPS